MYGRLTESNTASRKAAEKVLARMMATHITMHTLQEFTNFVAFEKQGERYTSSLLR
jgi:hypothetical protein